MRFAVGTKQLLDTDDVIKIFRRVSREVILRYHGRLTAGQISTKSHAEDFCTIADRKAEAVYKRQLVRLLPGSDTLGEETAKHWRSIRRLSAKRPLWVIDPIDGTSYYKDGKKTFGSMIALVHKGEILAGFIHFPVTGQTLYAVKNRGAFLDRRRVRVTRPRDGETLRGSVDWQFFEHDRRNSVPTVSLGQTTRSICSAYDYGDVMAPPNLHYSLRRWPKNMKPWDHLAGLRIVMEGGAHIRTWKGRQPDIDRLNDGILIASDRQTWNAVRKGFNTQPAPAGV